MANNIYVVGVLAILATIFVVWLIILIIRTFGGSGANSGVDLDRTIIEMQDNMHNSEYFSDSERAELMSEIQHDIHEARYNR